MEVSGYALITGAASGIGRATAISFAREGCLGLALADLNSPSLLSVADEARAAASDPIPIITFALDISDEGAVDAMVLETVRQFGRLDYAINNAGIILPTTGGVAGLDTDVWNKIMGVNLRGVFYCVRAEARAMLKQSPVSVSPRNSTIKQRGSIVNTSSVQGLSAAKNGSTAYVASKHGVVGLTKSASEDHARQGIRVNCVCPGYISTPINGDEEKQRATLPEIDIKVAMNRFGTAEEVADTILFLAGGRSSYVTGSAHVVDGGFLQS